MTYGIDSAFPGPAGKCDLLFAFKKDGSTKLSAVVLFAIAMIVSMANFMRFLFP